MAAINVAAEEVFDAFLIVGYRAVTHERMVLVNHGQSPACQDGLGYLIDEAANWKKGRVAGTEEGASLEP